MRQPKPAGLHPRPTPAAALEMLYARLRDIRHPSLLHTTLVTTLATILGDPSIALFLADSQRGGFRLAAGALLPPGVAQNSRLTVEALEGALSAGRSGRNGAGPGPGAVRLQAPVPGLDPFAPVVAVRLGPADPAAGVLLLGLRPDGRAYAGTDLRLLDLLAAAATTALEAVHLAEEHARSLQQLQGLHGLGEDLSANLDVEAVCQTVYEHLRDMLEFDSFFIARYDEEQGLLHFPFCTDDGQRYFIDPEPLGGGLSTWIFENGRALVIEDLSQGVAQLRIDYQPDKFGSYRSSRSWMGVPMIAKHRTIGVLSVHAYRPGIYRDEQVQFLSTVANQVAGALENARRLSQTDTALAARVAQLSALEEIARLLNASQDLVRIIQLVVARAVETTGAAAGIMALFDPAMQELRLLGQVGYPPDVLNEYSRRPLPISRGIIGRAVRENRSLLVRDVRSDADYIEVLPGVAAQLVVLVRRGGEVIGALSLESRDRDGFPAEHRDFVEHLAEHAAIAVENVRRYEQERQQNDALTRRAGELAAILRISNALKADLSLDEVLTQVAEGVRNSLGFKVAILSLIEDGPPRRFVRVASAGVDPQMWAQLKARRAPVEEGYRLMNPRFQISQSYFISHHYNMVTHLESYYRPELDERNDEEWHPDDMLLVPLRSRSGDLVGTLSVDDPVNRQLPTRATIETLEIFANQASVAIENARLFDEQGRRLREISLLQELGVGLAATLDPIALLHQVADSAVKLFDVYASIVVLVEDALNPRATTGAVAAERRGATVAVDRYPMERLAGITAAVLAGAAPLIISDTAAAEGGNPDLQAAGIGALIGLPLRAGNQLQGVLYLLAATPQTFSRPEQQLLQVFANQAAVALQNARLFEEEAHRLRDVTSLQDLGLSLTANLDISTLLEEATRSAVQLLNAASSGILLIDSDGRLAMNMRCWRRAGGQIEFARYESSVRPGGLTDTVLRAGRPLAVSDAEADPRVNPVTLAEGIRALVAVPIRAADQVLGVLFVNDEQLRAFTTHEQQLLQIFANQVAVAVTNARLFEERHAFERRLVAENERMGRELVTARATQRQLLPAMPRRLAGLALHGLCLPAMEVGGDYFDVLPLADGRLALAIGDVTGKGTSAVMLMAMIKTAVLSQVNADPGPAAVIHALNMLAIEFMQGQLMTFFYAIYDPQTRELTYGNAGHLYPYVRRAGGALESLAEGSLPLGAEAHLATPVGTTTLAPGDLLVMFSDGIVEATDAQGTLFSFGRLEALLEQAAALPTPRLLVEDILDRVHAFAGGAPQDDATLLIAVVE